MMARMTEQPSEEAAKARDSAECEAVLRLLLADGIGAARLHALRAAFGSAVAALDASPARIAGALRLREQDAARILAEARGADPQAERGRNLAAGARIAVHGDADYPALLSHAPDPPALLFVRGGLGPMPEPAVAIVGSRRATAYGLVEAGRLAQDLAARGVTVVSGGARGIDAEAHRGALRAGGRTIVVLASGLGHPYPPEHTPLFEQVAAQGGALVTEQPFEVRPRADLFPRRNRIVAGLSLLVVVVEAAARSGALLTARIAVDDLSRDAACVPGRVDSAASVGCHRAIREGWAQLVTGADDVMELVEAARPLVAAAMPRGIVLPNAAGGSRDLDGAAVDDTAPAPTVPAPHRTPVSSAAPVTVGPDASDILREIERAHRAGLDELERACGWPVPRIAMATLELEVKGLVRRMPDGAFVLHGRGR